MENKYSEYTVVKKIEIERLVTVRFLELSVEDVEVAQTYDFWEFLYVDVGEVSMGLDGSDFLLKQGDICFCKPGTRYSLQGNAPTSARIFSIGFFCDCPDMRVFYDKRGTYSAELAHHLPTLMQTATQCFEMPLQGLPPKTLTTKLDAVFGAEQIFVNRFELFLIELARREISPHTVPLVAKALLKVPI